MAARELLSIDRDFVITKSRVDFVAAILVNFGWSLTTKEGLDVPSLVSSVLNAVLAFDKIAWTLLLKCGR